MNTNLENRIKNETSCSGKWMSIKVSSQELNLIVKIQDYCEQLGMRQSISAILKRLHSIGLDNVDFLELEKSPLSLWETA